MAKKEANKDKKKEVKVKKHFFKDFKAELKKVIWPAPKQLVNNTTAVIVIVLITALLVAVFDLAFREANTYGIYKLQSYVDDKFNTKKENTDNPTKDTTENSETTEVENSGTEINVDNNTENNTSETAE